MTEPREVSIGELGDKVGALTDQIARLVSTIETTYVRKDVYELAHRQLEADVAAVEARQTLIARTAVTALMLPILVSVVVALVLGSLT